MVAYTDEKIIKYIFQTIPKISKDTYKVKDFCDLKMSSKTTVVSFITENEDHKIFYCIIFNSIDNSSFFSLSCNAETDDNVSLLYQHPKRNIYGYKDELALYFKTFMDENEIALFYTKICLDYPDSYLNSTFNLF